MKICDALETVYNDDDYSYDYSRIIRFHGDTDQKKSIKNIIKLIVPEWVFNERRRIRLAFNRLLLKLIHEKKIDNGSKRAEHLLFTEKMIKNNYSTDKEIEEICNRLRNIIKKNKIIA